VLEGASQCIESVDESLRGFRIGAYFAFAAIRAAGRAHTSVCTAWNSEGAEIVLISRLRA
jgi:hypothetical protein